MLFKKKNTFQNEGRKKSSLVSKRSALVGLGLLLVASSLIVSAIYLFNDANENSSQQEGNSVKQPHEITIEGHHEGVDEVIDAGAELDYYSSLGNAYVTAEDYENARKYYSKATEFINESTDPAVIAGLARSLYEADDKEEANKIFEAHLVGLSSEQPYQLLAVAVHAEAMEREEMASDLKQEALKLLEAIPEDERTEEDKHNIEDLRHE